MIIHSSEEVRVSVPTKNLKLVAFPGVNYNEKYIIEEVINHFILNYISIIFFSIHHTSSHWLKAHTLWAPILHTVLKWKIK